MTEARSSVPHVCRMCGEMKPIPSWALSARNLICNECNAARSRAYRAQHPEQRQPLRPKAAAVCVECKQPRQVIQPAALLCRSCWGKQRARDRNEGARRELAELFDRLIAQSEPEQCVEWPRARNRQGYGFFTTKRGKNAGFRAHRVVWEMVFGPIPDGLWVLHRCDNPSCVNHHHLWLGTARDNVHDMLAKGRNRPRGKSGRD